MRLSGDRIAPPITPLVRGCHRRLIQEFRGKSTVLLDYMGVPGPAGFFWLLAFCLRWASTTPLKDSCRNNGLVVFGGFTVHVRPHGLTQPVDEFRRSVASVAKHAREPINAE